MMAGRSPSVLVVGAGPTGLTAALELARRGIAPRIVDAKEGPTPLSKAVGISAHSLDILGPSQVAARLLETGLRVRHAHFYFERHELGVIDFSAVPHRYNFLLSLPQKDTETIMAERLADLGVTVEWRTRFDGLAEHNDTVEVRTTTTDGERASRSECVFGADGAKSSVREAIGAEFAGYTHKREWSIADAEISEWPYEPGSAQAFLHRDGDVGFIIPIGEDRFRAVSNTADALARVPGRYRIKEVLRTDRFHIPARQAEHYQTKRVFLGGDAAHAHSPIGARGMNLGIEDAAVFARRFADQTLAGYEAERRPVGTRWIKLSERILSAAQADVAFIQMIRNAALGIIGHVPRLQRPLLERVSGLRE